MTAPSSDPDQLPTGPIPPRSPLPWVLLAILVLALLGYGYFGRHAAGLDAGSTTPQDSGAGLPTPTAPTTP